MESLKIEARDIFEKLPDEGITLRVQGTSMQPFLHDGKDYVTFEKPNKKLKKGDVIVFKRGEFYLMHRIVKIDADGFITAMGDNTFATDTHIAAEDVKAVLVSAVRNGKRITPKSMEWLFFSKVFINVNFRKLIGKVMRLNED